MTKNTEPQVLAFPLVIATLGLAQKPIGVEILAATIKVIRVHGGEWDIDQLHDIDDAASHLDWQAQAMIYDALLSQGIND